MPPPHLHPRSRMTSSLFATTLVASFIVVALPHVLPCPAPRVTFADGEMVDPSGKRRRRRTSQPAETKDGIVQFPSPIGDDEKRAMREAKRECPVPKPGGVVGELLGFRKHVGEGGPRRPER